MKEEIKVFISFYIGINIGAFLAGIVVGSVGENINWHYGFGLAGIGMLIGQATFIWGQRYLKGVGDLVESPVAFESVKQSSVFTKFFRSPSAMFICAVLIVMVFVLFDGLGYRILFTLLSLFLGIGIIVYRELDAIEKDRVLVLLLSFLIVIVFWGAFEQAGGLMNIYAMDKTNRMASLMTIDLLFIAGIAYLIGMGVYHRLKGRSDYRYWFIGGAFLSVVFLVLRIFAITSNSVLIPASVFQSVNAFFIFTLAMGVAGFLV